MPDYFPFMHTYIAELMKLSSDERIAAINADQGTLFRIIASTDIKASRAEFVDSPEEHARGIDQERARAFERRQQNPTQ
jgi:hypothetical protein